ncbi:hypothetical protein [Candidatus Electronema sp. PJ]|uniref:DUF7507 domain-containing protein n=1 Tax=Candidatus Electronema sp. PJ TaxID=3401572 RepID=UPI003AA95A4E
MKMKFRTIVVSLLLGCALFVSGLVLAKETMTCDTSSKNILADKKHQSAATEPGIAICKADKTVKTGRDAWAYKVTNTGNVKLTNVRVTDDHFAKISCQQDALDVGESMGCTASEPEESANTASKGCAVADHVEFSKVGVTVTTKGDCVAGTD